jgi:hypothetical protein
VAWAADSKHLFTRTPGPASVRIDKLDLETGAREMWQVWKPKDAAGVLTSTATISMPTDGRFMVINFRTILGQLYTSESLK